MTKELCATVCCFRDLDKLNLPMVLRFKLEPIFDTAQAAAKNEAHFKSGQSRLENTLDLNP